MIHNIIVPVDVAGSARYSIITLIIRSSDLS